MAQQEQEPHSQRRGPPAGWLYSQGKGPPAGWRYSAGAKHRSHFRRWLAQVWRTLKNNAALVSAFVALFGILITSILTTWQQQEQIRQQQDQIFFQQELESQRAKAAAKVAEQQAQQESLQTYLGDMGELILRDKSPLGEARPESDVSTLARARTLTVLAGLGAQNKGILLQFLGEARLIQRVGERAPIITLSGADLSDVKLQGARLHDADLSGAYLSGAQGVTKDQLEQQAANLEGATMP